MTAWKLGSILNGLVGWLFIIFLITITLPIVPDSTFVREINDFITSTNIFTFNMQHGWRFLLFILFMLGYFVFTTYLPFTLLSRSIEDLHPQRSINTSAFTIYTIFGLLATPFGILFLLGMFHIKEDLWRIRENNFRVVVDETQHEELEDFDSEYDDFEEEGDVRSFYNEKYTSVGKDNPWKERPRREVEEPIQEEVYRDVDSNLIKKVDRIGRRLDDIEDDLYHQKRKTRKANKVLDNIQESLDNR